MIGFVPVFETISENSNAPLKFEVSEIPRHFVLLALQKSLRSSIFIAPSQIEY